MTRLPILSLFLITGLFFGQLRAQVNLPETERSLARMAQDILEHDSLSYKIKQNKAFASLLIETLKDPDSYHYPWDSLPSVSVLRADDDEFRLFTWHIVDKNYREYRGEQYHYYFGLIQRKITRPGGSDELIVIPLIENAPFTLGVENMQLDNRHWLGALYYPLRNHGNRIPSYTTKSRTIQARGDSLYVLGEGWVTGEIKRTKETTYYLLMGWNGADNAINYKVAEALYFDPENPERAIFGAGIFYFDPYNPRMRALFRYQENAPFSLNMGFIQKGSKPGKKGLEAIIYDHMGVPNFREGEPMSIYQAGPDGDYDAFVFDKKTGGFRLKKNAALADNVSRDMAKEITENQEQIVRARLDQLRYWAELMEDEATIKKIDRLLAQKTLTPRTVKMIRKQEAQLLENVQAKSEAEKARLKQAGLLP